MSEDRNDFEPFMKRREEAAGACKAQGFRMASAADETGSS
jgi:hypothetical protein